MLFVWPDYSQSQCSGSTTLVLFLTSFTTSSINTLGDSHARFLVWPAWILFSLGITLFLIAYLAIVGSDYSRDEDSMKGPHSLVPSFFKHWCTNLRSVMPVAFDVGFSALLVRFIMFALWVLYIASEL